MTKRIHVLLGGLLPGGVDGYFTSAGIVTLADMLKDAGFSVELYTWGQWDQVPPEADIVIGYSGGGSRATWAAARPNTEIDLLIAIDPSPRWQVKPIGPNVKRAICFKNSRPMMPSPYGMLGGGELVGPSVETIPISMQHLFVQYSAAIRTLVMGFVRAEL